MILSLLYYCGTEGIWILSLPGIKEIKKKKFKNQSLPLTICNLIIK